MNTFGPKTLTVGLHIPKCGGSSILQALKRIVPRGRLYQSTSLFENYRYGFLEFHHLPHVPVQELLALWGHNIHEQMLLRAVEFEKVILWTVVRDPVERLKSDLGYHTRQADALGGRFDPVEVMGSIQDPMCNYIIDRFPGLDPRNGSLAERTMAILNHFDVVLDIANSAELTEFLSWFGFGSVELPKENVAPGAGDIGFDTELLNAVTVNDRIVYERVCDTSARVGIEARLKDNPDRHQSRMSAIPPGDAELRRFMALQMYREYKAFGVLERAIESNRSLARSLLEEAEELELLQNGNVD